MLFLWDYLKNRLKEPTTWKAILSFSVGLGLKMTDAQMDLIAAAMIAVYAAVSAFLPEKK